MLSVTGPIEIRCVMSDGSWMTAAVRPTKQTELPACLEESSWNPPHQWPIPQMAAGSAVPDRASRDLCVRVRVCQFNLAAIRAQRRALLSQLGLPVRYLRISVHAAIGTEQRRCLSPSYHITSHLPADDQTAPGRRRRDCRFQTSGSRRLRLRVLGRKTASRDAFFLSWTARCGWQR
jgi:hypothetical protein